MLAVKCGNISVLSYLRDNQFSFKIEDNNQMSPILCAAQYNKVNSLDFLLKNNLGSLNDLSDEKDEEIKPSSEKKQKI